MPRLPYAESSQSPVGCKATLHTESKGIFPAPGFPFDKIPHIREDLRGLENLTIAQLVMIKVFKLDE